MSPQTSIRLIFKCIILLAATFAIFGCDSQRVKEIILQPTPIPTPTQGIVTTPTYTPTPLTTPPQQQIGLSKSKFHETNLDLVTENYDLAIVVGAPLTHIRSNSHRNNYEIDSGAFSNEAP